VHCPPQPDENHDQFHAATDDNCTGVNMDLIVEELGRFEPDSLDNYQEHMSQLAFFAMFPSILVHARHLFNCQRHPHSR
jgi:hypothetical protein